MSKRHTELSNEARVKRAAKREARDERRKVNNELMVNRDNSSGATSAEFENSIEFEITSKNGTQRTIVRFTNPKIAKTIDRAISKERADDNAVIPFEERLIASRYIGMFKEKAYEQLGYDPINAYGYWKVLSVK